MKTKPVCIESTLEIELGNRLVRLWINETELKSFYNNEHVTKQITKFCVTSMRTDAEIIEFVADNIPNCNAVSVGEIGKSERNGAVIYLIPFSEDVHG